MKSQTCISIIGMFLCIAVPLGAQGLQLAHNKKMRTIDTGTFIQIEVPKPNEGKCNSCPLNMVSGELISVDSEYLILRVVESNEYLVDQAVNVGYTYKKYTSDGQGQTVSIPKTNVLSIVLKGKHKLHPIHPLDALSNALMTLSIGTLAFASLGENRSDILIFVVSDVIIGSFVLASIFNQPFYKTSSQSAYKRCGRKIWVLN